MSLHGEHNGQYIYIWQSKLHVSFTHRKLQHWGFLTTQCEHSHEPWEWKKTEHESRSTHPSCLNRRVLSPPCGQIGLARLPAINNADSFLQEINIKLQTYCKENVELTSPNLHQVSPDLVLHIFIFNSHCSVATLSSDLMSRWLTSGCATPE